MHKIDLRRLSLAAMLSAAAAAGSVLSFPVLGSRCAPVQHTVNVLCAVLLGPGYGLGAAFCASLARNLLGLGSLMAFPGSMFGALFSALAYRRFHRLLPALLGEVAGTALLGGLCAWPVAVLLMGADAGSLAFSAYIFPFFLSTAVGALLAGAIILSLPRRRL